MRCLNCHQDGISIKTEICPKCGVHLPSLLRDVLPPGTSLRADTYRIDYAIGSGGFGITYRAHHTALEQLVAVKEFYPREYALRNTISGGLNVSSTQSETFERGLQRFIREGRILAQISHPHVVQVRDLFEERGTAYLAMELIEGQTLRQELEAHSGKRLSPKRVEEAMEQLVAALETIHQKNIYHLDLKPDNILFKPSGELVLVDFGAAKQGLGGRTTQAYTPGYAPLELMAGQQAGTQSDIFELGVMIYEMLTGEMPEWLKENWQPSKLEEPWASLVRAALKLRKEERPNSVREWWQKIDREIIKLPSSSQINTHQSQVKGKTGSWINGKFIEVKPESSVKSGFAPLQIFESLQKWWQDSNNHRQAIEIPWGGEDSDAIPLVSAIGNDYTHLQHLLAAGNYKEANEMTQTIMTGQQIFCLENSTFATERPFDSAANILQFPCEDLVTINRLWLKYSKERFGFSVQRAIWERLGGNICDFAKVIGWCDFDKHTAITYDKVKFTLSAPLGHLPCFVGNFYPSGDTCAFGIIPSYIFLVDFGTNYAFFERLSPRSSHDPLNHLLIRGERLKFRNNDPFPDPRYPEFSQRKWQKIRFLDEFFLRINNCGL